MNNTIKANNLYLILTGIFITSLVSCNLIFQKFFQLDINIPFIGQYTFEQSVVLLPYPITFLVTDIISEIYGQKKANQVVTTGLLSSFFMLIIITAADYVNAATWSPVNNDIFHQVFGLSGAAVFASMIAYLFAQYIDVRVFHFWKKLTNGKHLWLRNNISTMFSQLIDTIVVNSIFLGFGMGIEFSIIVKIIIANYIIKIIFAAIDTPLVYLFVNLIKKKYLIN